MNFLKDQKLSSSKLISLILLIVLEFALFKTNIGQGIKNNSMEASTLVPQDSVKAQSDNPPAVDLKDQPKSFTTPDNARIVFLHHSTGEVVWYGGVPQFLEEYNKKNGKSYKITEQIYPSTKNGYPWSNYPYDYYNLWVKHSGTEQDCKEQNLDQIAANSDIIIFKHCFPVGKIQEDTGKPDVNSDTKSLENYKLQYNALKNRMHQFPSKKFLVWTGPALAQGDTTPEQAERSKKWVTWVKTQWDTPGDNIFIWDFEQLETEGGLYFKYPATKTDSHPDSSFGKIAAADFVNRLIEVLNNKGDAQKSH